jgi:hypothetical protein
MNFHINVKPLIIQFMQDFGLILGLSYYVMDSRTKDGFTTSIFKVD